MQSALCSIFFHNYYGEHSKWLNLFSERMNVRFDLFYNIVEDSVYNLQTDYTLFDTFSSNISQKYLNKIILRESPNMGKDIGGKMVLMDAMLQKNLESDYIIFLHDKTSPYKIQNYQWREKLFRIIEPSFIEKAVNLFSERKEIGIIVASGSISDEFDHVHKKFSSTNAEILMNLQKQFNINTIDYRYISGTMFWARSLPILNFFKKNNPLEIRKTLEKGNVMDENKGSNTHAWERLLSWAVLEQGYTIKQL